MATAIMNRRGSGGRLNIANDLRKADELFWMSVAIGQPPTEEQQSETTFCSADCDNTRCAKNISAIQHPNIEHKFKNFKNCVMCRGYLAPEEDEFTEAE